MRFAQAFLLASLAVIIAASLWGVVEMLGLSGSSGNLLTIATSFLFFLLSFVRPDGAAGDDGFNHLALRPSGLFQERTALLLVAVCHLANWMLMLLLVDTLGVMVAGLMKDGLLTITDEGWQQYRLHTGGFIVLFWSIPMTVIFALWLGRRTPRFSYPSSLYAAIIAFAIYIVVRLIADPELLAQSALTLRLAAGTQANPFVSNGAILAGAVALLVPGFCLGVAFVAWLPMRIVRLRRGPL